MKTWREQAACHPDRWPDTDPQELNGWFYPDMPKGRHALRKDPYEKARPICAGCIVQDACLEESRQEEGKTELRWGQVPQHGFRAGLRPEERYLLFSDMRKYAHVGLAEIQKRAKAWRDRASRDRKSGRPELREKKWSEHQRAIDRERARQARRRDRESA